MLTGYLDWSLPKLIWPGYLPYPIIYGLFIRTEDTSGLVRRF